MIFNLSQQTLQHLAWIFALISSGLALYFVAMNWRHPTHRWVGLFLMIVATNQVAEGILFGANSITEAFLPSVLIAISSLMIMPMMGIVTLWLLKPEWLKERWKWAELAQWFGVTLIILPGLIILADLLTHAWNDQGINLYYSGLDLETYISGFVNYIFYTGGFLSPVLKTLNILAPFLSILVLCLYVAIFDKHTSRAIKLLAWIIFVMVSVSGIFQISLQLMAPGKASSFWGLFLLALVFGYASFHQMAVEHRLQRGNLQVRLTLMILAIVMPLLLAVVLFASSQSIPVVISLLVLLLLAGVIGLTVRQSLYPVRKLTETAFAVSEGDLNSQAPVESEDELGYLAEMFNRMTWQLKESISSLEDRVAERTADLERRSNQLKAAALVSKEAAGIRDIHQMMNQTVQLIANYFGFYHAGIFILDDVREYAVLQAANSEGGQRMLARGHKLRIGQMGIVGYVADVGIPRIALDVGDDAIFFNNPDLPLTRSEMALPLKARGQVIGVLDVQSIDEAAFSNDDIETLQVLADQVALALDNARLLKESRDALDELRNLYGRRTRQAWKERLEGGVLSYRYSRTGLIPGIDLSMPETSTEIEDLGEIKEPIIRINQQHEMLIPIILRGEVLGSLVLRREKEQNPWSHDEMQIAMDLIAQVLPALENARLVEEIQGRAQMETLLGQVSSRIQSSLDLETVLKTAVQEIGLVTNSSRVQIRLEKPETVVNQVDELHRDG